MYRSRKRLLLRQQNKQEVVCDDPVLSLGTGRRRLLEITTTWPLIIPPALAPETTAKAGSPPWGKVTIAKEGSITELG